MTFINTFWRLPYVWYIAYALFFGFFCLFVAFFVADNLFLAWLNGVGGFLMIMIGSFNLRGRMRGLRP